MPRNDYQDDPGPPQGHQPPAVREQPKSTIATLAADYLEGGGVGVLAGLVPEGLDQIAIANAFLATLEATPDLQTCTYQSLSTALRDCARMGLMPGPADHVYLIPYGQTCKAMVGYQGLIAMARRSAGVSRIETGEICEEDTFEASRGTSPRFKHRADWKRDRGPKVAWYAVAYFADGGPPQFEVMTKEQIEAIRDGHGNKALWGQHFDEKARITVVRRLCKWLGKDDALGHAFSVMDRDEQPAPVTVTDVSDTKQAIRARMAGGSK